MNLNWHIRKNDWAWTALLFLILPLLCWMWDPFMIEDAFITFRYSRNLANGLGPVYNSGEHVEGYTAPLWMLLMTLPFLLGQSVVAFSAILGCLFLAATGLVWMKIFRQMGSNKRMSLLFGFVIVSQSTLLGFSYSGMETIQNLFLLSLLLERVSKYSSSTYKAKEALFLGLLVFLVLLSRPDNVVFVLTILGLAIWDWKAGRFPAFIDYFKRAMLVLVPLLALFALWKLWFYGDLLPNTFYAKRGGLLHNGLQYLAVFSLGSGLTVYWALGAFFVLFRKKTNSILLRFALIFPAIWMLYILWIGGDFMEFRMMAPCIPLMIFVAGRAAEMYFVKAIPKYLVLGALIASNLLLSYALNHWYYNGIIVTLPKLANETGNSGKGNIIQGQKLHALFADASDFRIASGGAGAMPFYAECYVLDMIGLNDSEIAQMGFATAGIPGHRRFVGLDVLNARKVNLVVGAWRLLADTAQTCSAMDINLQKMLGENGPIPKNIRLLSIPLEKGWEMRVAYLKKHPAVESALAAKKLREIQLVWEE